MTQGPDGCIYVFHPRVWEQYMRKLRQKKLPPPEKLMVMRTVLAPATNCTVDSQWRIKPPDELVQYAGLDREIEVVGQIDRFEIWNPQRRAANLARQPVDYSSVAADLFVGEMPDDEGLPFDAS